MILRTEFISRPSNSLINLKNPLLLSGSCFSENIGKELSAYKFQTLINPFGTLYNPHSIFQNISKSVQGNHRLDEAGIIYNQGAYRHIAFHSSVSHPDKNRLFEMAGESMARTKTFLSDQSWLILTFGSAIVYIYKKTGDISANCHKLPAENFYRKFMTVDEIAEGFDRFHKVLSRYNPGLKILLTVSPVRHLREGFEDNQISKSILRLACKSIMESHTDIFYFPSYEIMMDDLRDYRFYDRDMVHPNALGIEYLWNKFKETFIDTETKEFMKEWHKILTAIRHRPFHTDTDEYRLFLQNTLEKLRSFKEKVNVDDEIKKFEERL